MSAAVYSLAAARERMRRRAAAIAEAQEARAAKYIRAIDATVRRSLDAHDVRDPHTRAILFARESAWVVSEIKAWTPAQWYLIGRIAGISGYPSDDTKALVIEHFEWCSENVVEVRVSQ